MSGSAPSLMAIAAALSVYGNGVVLGALLFFASDHLIASNAFLGGVPFATVLIITS